MRSLIVSLVLLALTLQSFGQKIKFKLTFSNGVYTGTMSPKWYSTVQLTPIQEGSKTLQNAQGSLIGTRFGTTAFALAHNELGTKDSLMIKMDNGWYPVTITKLQKNILHLSFNWGFRVHPRLVDQRVLQRADELLVGPLAWNQHDDRDCTDDSQLQKWSLYCALRQACIDKMGDFNHRGAALELVRKRISALNPSREYQHQLMEFNNEREFSQIKELLRDCQQIMADLTK